LRSQAAGFRARIDPRELAAVSADAKEANAIIDRRAFSWTMLFSQFEQALPPDVRITAVQPRREQNGTFAVNIGIQARRVEDVEAFIEALEARTPFKQVLATEEQTADNGLIEAIIDGKYFVERPGATAAPAPASGPDATASATGKRASR
jgi:Tfp pilus assembly protein PilN